MPLTPAIHWSPSIYNTYTHVGSIFPFYFLWGPEGTPRLSLWSGLRLLRIVRWRRPNTFENLLAIIGQPLTACRDVSRYYPHSTIMYNARVIYLDCRYRFSGHDSVHAWSTLFSTYHAINPVRKGTDNIILSHRWLLREYRFPGVSPWISFFFSPAHSSTVPL